jgi:hypothetical protein
VLELIIKKGMDTLRIKTPFHLINGQVELTSNSFYPFENEKVPIMCSIPFEEKSFFNFLNAYESGNRSVVFIYDGKWFKAKAIGIPRGTSQPLFYKGSIFSYYLENEPTMGTGSAIWGFLTLNEANREMLGLKIAEDKNLPSPKLVGMGFYKDLYVMRFKNRFELYKYLGEKNLMDRLNDFNLKSQKMDSACIFSITPSDLRVDEILYGFIFPEVETVLDLDECKDYIMWLGSSCAWNLRQIHEAGILHGTIMYNGGVNTNSYLGNHIVGETQTWITDYDLTYPLKKKSEANLELRCLIDIMNPLNPFSYITKAYITNDPFLSVFSIFQDLSSPFFYETLYQSSFREKIFSSFVNGVKIGYYKKKKYEIEDSLKRRILWKAIMIKNKMWQLYGIPKEMIRGIKYIEKIISEKKICKNELNKALSSIQDIP